MNESIFRKKSLERISSPEEIDNYIKVTSPSMWLVMGAIIFLLATVVIWSITVHIETTCDTVAQAENGQVVVELTAEQIGQLAVGSEVRVGDKSGQVTDITEKGNDYLITASIPEVKDGIIEITLVTESIKPIDFLIK